MSELPVVSESGQEALDPALALAAAGWEAVGRGQEDRDFFRCSICLRTHVVQAFSHESQEVSEPPTKKRRETPSGWTPEIRVTSPAAVVREAERGWFDPHAMHHYYCPLFCHPEEMVGKNSAWQMSFSFFRENHIFGWWMNDQTKKWGLLESVSLYFCKLPGSGVGDFDLDPCFDYTPNQSTKFALEVLSCPRSLSRFFFKRSYHKG